jgi:hypothetical protein
MMHEVASEALGQDIGGAMKDRRNWAEIDGVLAAASPIVHSHLDEMLGPLGPMIAKMTQKANEMRPPMPMDPSAAALQVAKIEDARERDLKGKELNIRAQEVQQRGSVETQKNELKGAEIAIKDKDVSAKHGIAAGKIELDAAKLAEDSRRADDDARRADEQEEHARGLDMHVAMRDDADMRHRHNIKAADQRHRHELEQMGAARDDADHRLRAADAALKADEQAHRQTLDVAGHVQSTQKDAHAARMSEAEMAQRKAEHRDGMKQADKERESSERQARAKAKDGANSKGSRPKKRK